MTRHELKPGSACVVPGMREELLAFDKPVMIRRKGSWSGGSGRACPEMLVVEMDSTMLPWMERNDWAREPNRYMANERGGEVRPGQYYGQDTRDLQYLLDLHRHGWPEGVAKAMELAEEIRDAAPMATKNRRRPRWSDQGDEIDMRRVYSGMLDRAWRTTRKEPSHGPKVISIDVDVCWNANVNAKDLFWSGACAVAITDVLEDAGYRVELFVTAVTEENNRACLTRMVVKRADEPLNPNAVAALAAHPATYRYHIRKSWCRAPWGIGYGYGHAMEMLEPLQAAVERGTLEASDLQICGALSKQAAVQALKSALAKLEQAGV